MSSHHSPHIRGIRPRHADINRVYPSTSAALPGHQVTNPTAVRRTSTASAGIPGGFLEGARDAKQNKSTVSSRASTSSATERPSYQAFVGRSPPLQAMKMSTERPELQSRPSEAAVHMHNKSGTRHEDGTVLGVALPGKARSRPLVNLPPQLIPELQRLAATSSRSVNQPWSSISSVGSPASDITSASPWSSVPTNTTTPISFYSSSPSIYQTSNTPNSKKPQIVPPSTSMRLTGNLSPVSELAPELQPKPKKSTSIQRKLSLSRSIPKTSTPESATRSASFRGSHNRVGSRSRDEGETGASLLPDNIAATIAAGNTVQQGRSQINRPSIDAADRQVGKQEVNSQTGLARDTYGVDTAAYRPRRLLESAPILEKAVSGHHQRQISSADSETLPPTAPSRLGKFSRLGSIFGRSKRDLDVPQKAATKLEVKKGPTAGTGHERYSRFGRRTQRTSFDNTERLTGSNISLPTAVSRPTERRQSRNVSGQSTKSQLELDEFALPRSKPVAMLGGSQRGRLNAFPLSPTNLDHHSATSDVSETAQNRWPEPRRERFIDDFEPEKPSLVTRRSQKSSVDEDSFRFPEPITTANLPATPALDSRNTTQSSDLPTPINDMHIIDPTLLERQRKRGKMSNWNPFRRKESISGVDERPTVRHTRREGVEVNLASMHRPTQLPYYAVATSNEGRTTAERIGQYLQEAAQSSPEKSESQSVATSVEQDFESIDAFRDSLLLPKAPSRRTSAASSMTSVPAIINPLIARLPNIIETLPPPQRQPRLAQVGRIPKVVSSRQQQVQPVIAPTVSLHPPINRVVRRMASREQLPRLDTRVSNIALRAKPKTRTEIISSSIPVPNIDEAQPEFLRFPEVRDSDLTTSSESTGIISIIGPPLSAETQSAITTERRADQFARQDEVWGEYDDYMDTFLSPSVVAPIKKTSRLPKQAIKKSKDDNSMRGLAITPAPTASAKPQNQFLQLPQREPVPSSSLQSLKVTEDIRLRRSRIQEALRPSFISSSPFSMREFLDEYGRPVSGAPSNLSDRLSNNSAHGLTVDRPSPIIEIPTQPPTSQLPNPSEQSISKGHASLMVSRWLSFGRVLFSPAHNEISSMPERHILVIDGLKAEDWSIYCANTYRAENAYVHDLREQPLRVRNVSIGDSVDAPPNHRRAIVASLQERFPFPPAFFTCIVIRFPGNMPDAKLKNVVSECRRVLAPGGYLELMILDLDIVNMGVTTRRAVKDLKIRMSARDANTSLKPIIDNLSTTLNSNGFGKVIKCLVGVPVVGKPTTSLDSSSESRSSGGSMAKVLSNTSTTSQGHNQYSSTGARPYGNSSAMDTNFSLNELVSDHSENADAKIGRMVSRTARSWWQTCFEKDLGQDRGGEKSILSRKEVLNECKTRAANFKLLIAYTQKPVLERGVGNRRTMSEPTVPTLATAGIGQNRL